MRVAAAFFALTIVALAGPGAIAGTAPPPSANLAYDEICRLLRNATPPPDSFAVDKFSGTLAPDGRLIATGIGCVGFQIAAVIWKLPSWV